MAKIKWVEDRLNLWVEWVVRGRTSGGGGGATHPMWSQMPRVDCGVRHEARIPLNDDECDVTEKAIKALPDPLRQTLWEYYLNGTIAAQDRLGISRAVLSQRLDRAHKMLAEVFLAATRQPAWSRPKGF